jgi:adenylate cyclase
MSDDPSGRTLPPRSLTRFQRWDLKRLVRAAGKGKGEPLDEADWEAYFSYSAEPLNRVGRWFLRSLPSSPRCGFCGAPFQGFGGAMIRPLGYRPSTKNPNLCSTCVELSPPGGATLDMGVLFADVRGFTSLSERAGPQAARGVLSRFYACAEQVFFPEALIDKVIGDAVMALYIPTLMASAVGRGGPAPHAKIAQVMLSHARELLERMGYGTEDGPEVDVGVGLAFGKAFIGHVGRGAVHDFTAIGDVVNTASRLQGVAGPGEAVLSANLAALLPEPVGIAETVTLKGKQNPLATRRVSWFGT